jgi:hypothetical protein
MRKILVLVLVGCIGAMMLPAASAKASATPLAGKGHHHHHKHHKKHIHKT